jgi:hypothetical protein
MGTLVPKGWSAGMSEAKFFLSSDAYCCEFHDGAVILDMRAVTYVGIDAEYARILRTRIENWPHFNGCDSDSNCAVNPAVEELVENLVVRGILTTVPTRTRTVECDPPTTGWSNPNWSTAPHRIPISHALLFSTSSLQVLLRHKGRGLASLLGWIGRHQAAIRRTGRPSDRQHVIELLESFFRLRIWFYTAYRHCLFDSLVLSVYLTRRRVPCALVIGVSTRPFAAHAWVQIGECAVNDTVEHVLAFAPILAVGGTK